MIENQITTKDLADMIGSSERLIRHWRSGNCQPRFFSGIYIIKALSRLSNKSESEIYAQISAAVLKDN